jgi:hypothetical protein
MAFFSAPAFFASGFGAAAADGESNQAIIPRS